MKQFINQVIHNTAYLTAQNLQLHWLPAWTVCPSSAQPQLTYTGHDVSVVSDIPLVQFGYPVCGPSQLLVKINPILAKPRTMSYIPSKIDPWTLLPLLDSAVMQIKTHWVFLLAKENLHRCLPSMSSTEEMLQKITVNAAPLPCAGSYDQDLRSLRGNYVCGPV